MSKQIKMYCHIQIFCYNILIKGNRHRVVDQDIESKKPSKTRAKYREGFLLL